MDSKCAPLVKPISVELESPPIRTAQKQEEALAQCSLPEEVAHIKMAEMIFTTLANKAWLRELDASGKMEDEEGTDSMKHRWEGSTLHWNERGECGRVLHVNKIPGRCTKQTYVYEGFFQSIVLPL